MVDNTNTTENDVAAALAGAKVSETRMATLRRAAEAGADRTTLRKIARAQRVRKHPTMILPGGPYDHLSRGKGWCRMGSGKTAQWATRDCDGNWEVGPGRWTVGSTDGFSRSERTEWTVHRINVGTETWTIAD